MSKFGVVLSSGGGRGVFAHTGFMSALEKLEIRIFASAGCSAGAIVGGVLASGADFEEWTNTLKNVRVEQFWTPRSYWQLLYNFGFRQGKGIAGFSDTSAAVRFLAENLRVDTFEECIYPFAAIALNIGTGKSVIFREGPLALGMMASAAVPGFYNPVKIGDQYYTDGAIIDLAPANAICCRYDLDVLLVHHTAQVNYLNEELGRAFNQPWTMAKIMQRVIFRRRPWYATGQPLSMHACPCGCKAIIVVIEPKLPELAWPITSDAARIIGLAHSHALAQLEPILEPLHSKPHSLLA